MCSLKTTLKHEASLVNGLIKSEHKDRISEIGKLSNIAWKIVSYLPRNSEMAVTSPTDGSRGTASPSQTPGVLRVEILGR